VRETSNKWKNIISSQKPQYVIDNENKMKIMIENQKEEINQLKSNNISLNNQIFNTSQWNSNITKQKESKDLQHKEDINLLRERANKVISLKNKVISLKNKELEEKENEFVKLYYEKRNENISNIGNIFVPVNTGNGTVVMTEQLVNKKRELKPKENVLTKENRKNIISNKSNELRKSKMNIKRNIITASGDIVVTDVESDTEVDKEVSNIPGVEVIKSNEHTPEENITIGYTGQIFKNNEPLTSFSEIENTYQAANKPRPEISTAGPGLMQRNNDINQIILHQEDFIEFIQGSKPYHIKERLLKYLKTKSDKYVDQLLDQLFTLKKKAYDYKNESDSSLKSNIYSQIVSKINLSEDKYIRHLMKK